MMYRMENGPSPVPKHLEHLAINLYHALRLARNSTTNPANIGWSGLGQDVAKIRVWPKDQSNTMILEAYHDRSGEHDVFCNYSLPANLLFPELLFFS